MGVRESLAKKPSTVIPVAVVLILGGTWSIMHQLKWRPVSPNTAYYTVDDGTSCFTDDMDKFPPFAHDGLQAVQAHMFDCDGHRFVGYLSRYTSDAKAILETNAAEIKVDPTKTTISAELVDQATKSEEYKLPGETGWKRTIPRMTVKCKNGSDPGEVMPWGPLNGPP